MYSKDFWAEDRKIVPSPFPSKEHVLIISDSIVRMICVQGRTYHLKIMKKDMGIYMNTVEMRDR